MRRELELVEGDAYNQLKIDRSLRKYGAWLFPESGCQTLPGSTEDQSVVQFDVEEQPTGDFSVGLGYSSIDKTTLTLGIKERNFLVRVGPQILQFQPRIHAPITVSG